MKDLSVLDVQRILRAHADPKNNGGHDVISNPGAVTVKGTTFPLALSHHLTVEHPDNNRLFSSALSTDIPLNESGNVMEVGSKIHKPATFKSSHEYVAHYPRVISRDNDDFHTYQRFHAANGPLRDKGADPDLIAELIHLSGKDPKEYYKKAQQLPSVNGAVKHDPSKAAWEHMMGDFFSDEMRPTSWFPKPFDMDIRHFGKVIGIVHGKDPTWETMTTHLYSPTTEKLITLGTHQYDREKDVFKLL